MTDETSKREGAWRYGYELLCVCLFVCVREREKENEGGYPLVSCVGLCVSSFMFLQTHTQQNNMY